MGLRSWLTPVGNKEEWVGVQSSIEENPYAYGIHYIIHITEAGSPFPVGSVVVAWSANGSSSIEELTPKECRDRSWLLDNFLEVFPEWHAEPGGPGKFGSALTNEKEVDAVFDG